MAASKRGTALWQGRATFFGLIPLFEWYTLYSDRLRIRRGLVFKTEDEIMLHRVLDIKLRLFLLGVGDVVLYSRDVTDPTLVLRCVRNAPQVRDVVRDAVYDARRRTGVAKTEMIGAALHSDVFDIDDDQ